MVVVIPHDVEQAQFHVGCKGVLQAAGALALNVKVDFLFHEMEHIVHVNMTVPTSSLRIVEDDDVCMLPNSHPWLTKKVTVAGGCIT